jgi:hypothetical protein
MARVQVVQRNDTGTIICSASGGTGNPKDMIWLLSDPFGDGLGAKRDSYSQHVFIDNPLAYWRGDVSGSLVVDFMGVNHGTYSGGLTLTATAALSDKNPALLFDGTTGKVL